MNWLVKLYILKCKESNTNNQIQESQYMCNFVLLILHLLLIFSLGCKVCISASPRMQWDCRLVMKKVFWTHKVAVGPNDVENSESQDPLARN